MASFVANEPFKLFRNWVPQQKLDTANSKTWKYYDFGPKDVDAIVFLPGASGTAESFYGQFISMCPKGYRLVSVQYADYMTHDDWCLGFSQFLDKLGLKKIHLFGTSLGGYLAQCYVAQNPDRVASLILCNTFSDTTYYKDHAPCIGMFSWMPDFVLKRMILSNFPDREMESKIAESVDFMVNELETISQKELASRLTLNCSLAKNFNGKLTYPQEKITIIDTLDEVAVPEQLRKQVYEFYPNAKVCSMKNGGNFPYISRPDEFNLYLEVHLRNQGVIVNPSTKEIFEIRKKQEVEDSPKEERKQISKQEDVTVEKEEVEEKKRS